MRCLSSGTGMAGRSAPLLALLPAPRPGAACPTPVQPPLPPLWPFSRTATAPPHPWRGCHLLGPGGRGAPLRPPPPPLPAHCTPAPHLPVLLRQRRCLTPDPHPCPLLHLTLLLRRDSRLPEWHQWGATLRPPSLPVPPAFPFCRLHPLLPSPKVHCSSSTSCISPLCGLPGPSVQPSANLSAPFMTLASLSRSLLSSSPILVHALTYDFTMSPDPKTQCPQHRRNRRGCDFPGRRNHFWPIS